MEFHTVEGTRCESLGPLHLIVTALYRRNAGTACVTWLPFVAIYSSYDRPNTSSFIVIVIVIVIIIVIVIVVVVVIFKNIYTLTT